MATKPTLRSLLFLKPSELALSLKILIPTAFIFLLFVYFSFWVVLPYMEKKLMDQRRQMLRSIGGAVWHLVDGYHQKTQSGLISDTEARSRAVMAVQGLRFEPEERGCFWINDFSSVTRMRPTPPEREGPPLETFFDPVDCQDFDKLLEQVRQMGEGFIECRGPLGEDPSRRMRLRAYVKLYDPWGWVLGTAISYQDVHLEIVELRRLLIWLLVGVGGVALVFGLYIYWQAWAVEVGRQRAEEINRVLTRIANAVNMTADMDALYRTIHGALGGLVDVTNFFVALYNREKRQVAFPYYRDTMDPETPPDQNVEHTDLLTAKVILTGRPVLANRAGILAWAARQGAVSVGTLAAQWLGVPLKIRDEVIGVMATQSYSDADSYDQTDIATFVSVANQVAVALERRRNEAALRQSVRQYQMLAENHRDVVVALSPAGRLTYCSPAIREFGGYEPAEEIGRHIGTYFADDGEKVRGLRRFVRMVKNRQVGVFEMQFKANGKAPFPVEIGLKPMIENGAVVSVMCVLRDISERKAAELQLKHARDALEMRVRERTDDLLKSNLRLENEIREHRRTEAILRESEEKYRTLVENIPDVIYSTNDHGDIVTVNNPSQTFFGYQVDEVLGRNFSFFLHPEDRQVFADLFSQAIKERTEITKGFQGRLIAKKGAICWIEANLRRQFDADGHFMRTDGVLRDVTQTKMLQERLIRSERLAATGQLAASVAHEINSPLQGVTSLLNVIHREYGSDPNLATHLALIKGAFSSIRNTVKNLMDLNRPGKERNQPLRLVDILTQTSALVKGYLKDNGVRLHLTIPADLPLIMGSPQQLGQVFMNLISNAVEAMSAEPEHMQRFISIVASLDNGYIVVTVADTGSGIADEDLPHIFDAFFTRKKRMGMGVGLAICHRIIEEHSGSISVRNLSPWGAEFSVRLPVNRSENRQT